MIETHWNCSYPYKISHMIIHLEVHLKIYHNPMSSVYFFCRYWLLISYMLLMLVERWSYFTKIVWHILSVWDFISTKRFYHRILLWKPATIHLQKRSINWSISFLFNSSEIIKLCPLLSSKWIHVNDAWSPEHSLKLSWKQGYVETLIYKKILQTNVIWENQHQ